MADLQKVQAELLGCWKLVRFQDVPDALPISQPHGTETFGRIIFSNEGWMSAALTPPERAKPLATPDCPKLDAIFSETLRQRTNAFGWRVVKEETVIRGKKLVPGTPVLIPMRVLHTNKNIWGSDVEKFDPNRFCKKVKALQQPYYRPFAGGPTYCPGRILAKRETYPFLTILLHRFYITLLPSFDAPGRKPAFPLMEACRPPTGVKGPQPNMDLLVRLDERASEKSL